MVNDKQPFELRCAILYCLQCYLHKNLQRQEEIMNTLLPSHETVDENEITAGQLLCGGLFSNDGVSNWLSAVALAHGMMDQEALKTELLKVQVASIKDSGGTYVVCVNTSVQVMYVHFTTENYFAFFWRSKMLNDFEIGSFRNLRTSALLNFFFCHFQDHLLCSINV